MILPAFLAGPAITKALPWIGRIVAVLAIVAAVWGAWWAVNHWCNAACKEATARAVTAEGLLEIARKRATDMALLYAKELNNVKERYVERVVVRDKNYGAVRERIGKITEEVLIPVPAPYLAVLRDAGNLANANNPTAAGGDKLPAEAVPPTSGDGAAEEGEEVTTTLKEWAEFAVDASEAYADAVDKHRAVVDAYNKLIEIQKQINAVKYDLSEIAK